jgi:hypothetical protein
LTNVLTMTQVELTMAHARVAELQAREGVLEGVVEGARGGRAEALEAQREDRLRYAARQVEYPQP